MTGHTFLRVFALVFVCLHIGCASSPEEVVVATNAPLAPQAPEVRGGAGGEVEKQRLDPNRVVARINSQIITFRALQGEYGDALASLPDVPDEEKLAIIDRLSIRLIFDRLLADAAERKGIPVSNDDLKALWENEDRALRKRVAEVKREAAEEGGLDVRDLPENLAEDLHQRGVPKWEWEENAARRLRIQRFLAVCLGYANTDSPLFRQTYDIAVRPGEASAYYERNREQYRTEESAEVQAVFLRLSKYAEPGLRSSEVRKRCEEAARRVIARARGGESFDAIVKEFHEEPLSAFSKPIKRGDRRGDQVEEFAWSANVGGVSEPFAMGSGLLVVKLAGRTGEGVQPFSEVEEEIRGRLTTLKEQAAILQIQSDLLREAVVEPARLRQILRDNLDRDLQKMLEELSR